MRNERALPALALLAAALLGGCAVAPHYEVPKTPTTEHFADHGPWQPAQPADQLPRDGWWKIYGEAELDHLQDALKDNNTDLAAALAHYNQAQAYSAQARSAYFPTIGFGGNAQRERESDTKPLRGATAPAYYGSYTVDASIDYEVDLWGKVRASVEAGRDEALAAAADLASVQLSLQAQLTGDYLQLRDLDQQVQLLQQSMDAYTKALQLTQTRHAGGIASGLDEGRAQTQLSDARSQLAQAQAQRELMQHAIAVLVGQSPSDFHLDTATRAVSLPSIPLGVPSTLLQRRPDVAAAERRVAEANARIGIARAAYFPSLTLDAMGGWQSNVTNSLLTAPNHLWAIGPSLLFDVFDGGKRKAGVKAAKAATDEAAAKYRGTVLDAFQQVEDSLSQLDHLGSAHNDQKAAADAAQHVLDLAMNRYRAGAMDYLDVVQAQTTALEAQRSLLDLDTHRLLASVQLVRALGGGWEAGHGYATAANATPAASN